MVIIARNFHKMLFFEKIVKSAKIDKTYIYQNKENHLLLLFLQSYIRQLNDRMDFNVDRFRFFSYLSKQIYTLSINTQKIMQLNVLKDLSTTYDSSRKLRFQRTVKPIPLTRSRSLQQNNSTMCKFYIKNQFASENNQEQVRQKKQIKELRQKLCRKTEENLQRDLSLQRKVKKEQNYWSVKNCNEEKIINNSIVEAYGLIQAKKNPQISQKVRISIKKQNKTCNTKSHSPIQKESTIIKRQLAMLHQQNQHLKNQNEGLKNMIKNLELKIKSCTNCQTKQISIQQLKLKIQKIQDQQRKLQTIKLAALQECLRKTQKELFEMKETNKHLNIELNCLQMKFHSKLQNQTVKNNQQILMIKQKYMASLEVIKKIKQNSRQKSPRQKFYKQMHYNSENSDNIFELSDVSAFDENK